MQSLMVPQIHNAIAPSRNNSVLKKRLKRHLLFCTLSFQIPINYKNVNTPHSNRTYKEVTTFMAIGPILGQKKHVYYMKEGVLYVHYDKGGGGFQIISFVAPSFLKYNYCNTIYLLAQF